MDRWRSGRRQEAAQHAQRALEIFRETDARLGEAHTLTVLAGMTHQHG